VGLTAEIAAVDDLTDVHVQEMIQIMQRYYENVVRDQFLCDLKEKDWVILLMEKGRIRGFSTQMLINHYIEGRHVRLIFSGDTIIEKSSWGSLALPLAWGRLMLSIRDESPNSELYWLLTTKGYKTYRFLPVFFREFYPCYHRQAPPFEMALLDSIGRGKSCDQGGPDVWIHRASKGAQRLRPGVAEITEVKRRDRHLVFFEISNPDHTKGDELVCIARCHEENLTPFILRRIRS